MGIEAKYTPEEREEYDIGTIIVPQLIGLNKNEVKSELNNLGYTGEVYYSGQGEIVVEQFPLQGEKISKSSDLILYLQ